MKLDIWTLFVVTIFIMGMGGLLLLFTWLQNRRTTALLWWGATFIILTPATALFALRGSVSEFWSIHISNALFLVAYGTLWTGTRVFGGREPRLPWILAGAIIWLVACQFDSFMQSMQARMVLASILIDAYCFAFIWELWRGRGDRLISRWPTMALMAFHASLYLVRIPFANYLPFPMGALPQTHSAATFMVFSFLFHTFGMAFLLLALAKERAELNHKRASLIDPLTDIPNRRGFTARADRLIARCKAGNIPLTLLLCDLDTFKKINDRYGHMVGDDVLVNFAQCLTASLRPLDLAGRIGGEEFVALLPDIPVTAVMDIAERIRNTFESSGRTFQGHDVRATVSIGTASAAKADYSFATLYAAADEALYRAKQKGRNRVEIGRPALALMSDGRAP